MKSTFSLKWTLLIIIGVLVFLFRTSVYFLYAALALCAVIIALTFIGPKFGLFRNEHLERIGTRPRFEDETIKRRDSDR